MISSPTVVDEDNGMGTMERRKTTGQILWIRGLTRLQTQVRLTLSRLLCADRTLYWLVLSSPC